MVRRLLRQRFGSPLMAIALGVLVLMGGLQASLSDPERQLESGFLAIVLLGAGVVSKDASGGALQMILSRPIRRTDYLMGRYLGVLTAYALLLATTAALAVLLSVVLPRLFGPPYPPLDPARLAGGVLGGFLNGALFAAMLLFFSTFLRGYADVLAVILLNLALSLPVGLANLLHRPWIERAGEVVRENVLPRVEWGQAVRDHRLLAEPTGRYVLALAAFLVFAVLVFSRRQFAYGQD